MANSRKANVLVFDTTGAVTQHITSHSIVFIPGTGSPAASIAAADGTTIWESGATRVSEQVRIIEQGGITVTLAGTGTKLYIYLE